MTSIDNELSSFVATLKAGLNNSNCKTTVSALLEGLFREETYSQTRRALNLRWHPDRNSTSDTTAIFQAIEALQKAIRDRKITKAQLTAMENGHGNTWGAEQLKTMSAQREAELQATQNEIRKRYVQQKSVSNTRVHRMHPYRHPNVTSLPRNSVTSALIESDSSDNDSDSEDEDELHSVTHANKASPVQSTQIHHTPPSSPTTMTPVASSPSSDFLKKLLEVLHPICNEVTGQHLFRANASYKLPKNKTFKGTRRSTFQDKSVSEVAYIVEQALNDKATGNTTTFGNYFGKSSWARAFEDDLLRAFEVDLLPSTKRSLILVPPSP